MLMVFKGIKQEFVYVADTEYDRNSILQAAGLVFQRIDERNDIYQLAFSFNYYIKQKSIHPYIQKFTGITTKFLKENGLTKKEFIDIYDHMFYGINPKDVLFISHGTQADKKIIESSEVKFIPEHYFCTYKAAKRILEREEKLTLTDVAMEAGYMLQNTHDAYADAVATAFVFSFLKKIEWQNS